MASSKNTPFDLGNLDYFDSWGSLPQSATPRHVSKAVTHASQDPQDEFFLGFTATKPPTPAITSAAPLNTQPAASAEQFISRIPDLSFMTANSLMIPIK